MTTSLLHRTFLFLACLVVGTAVTWGFFVVGSPAQERLRKLDERRIQDLQAIRRAVRSLCIEQVPGKTKLVAPLPESLDELDQRVRRGDVVSQSLQLKDPQSGEVYGYRRVGESQFELCAQFDSGRASRRDPFWNHASGEACFRFDLLEHAEGVAPTAPGKVQSAVE